MFMLSLELKDTADRAEFGPEIKRVINQNYMEDGEKYNEEIRQIEQLRMNAINATRDFNGISTLKKYYGQLHNLASRFPMEEGGEAAIFFSWIDTFDEEPFTHADIRFEQACILYNLGALHSVLGAKESRTVEEEMKVACTHFQCAAGIFTYLKENFQSDTSPDISFELMAIYIQTMLGQAQECLLEKSMQDNRKSSLVARISAQVVDYYKQALKGLDDINITSLLGSRRTKLWKRTLTVKMLHFASISYLYMSNQSEEQQKFGERVAYLQEATNKHNEAMKSAKGQHESVMEALNFAKDVIIGKFQSAKKDNDFVYHEKVPDIDSLPEVKGASLVKALPFQPYDESVAGPDIFRKLVPMKAHEASSMYSEEKAKLLRQVTAEIEEKDTELEQYMASLQVEQLKLGEEEPEKIPQVLLEVCAAVSVKEEPIKALVTSMQGLSNVVLDVDGAINEIDAILEEEETAEKQFQKDFGPRTAKSYDEVKKDLAKCKELHLKASQSNTELRKAMETHMENIKILASPLEEIQEVLPSLKAAEASVDKDAESNLKRLLEKVEEMKKQRKDFEQQLREALQKDDVTNTIVTQQQGNLQAFFQEQLEKHTPLQTYISQNLSAQDNILRALTDAHAAYADSRKVTADTAQRREDRIQELITSYTVYDDLIAKSNKGIDFYKKLEVTVSKLLARTKELVQASQNERKEKSAKLRAPQRPFAPKPAPGVPALPVGPQGPKLSDFWQPKSSPKRRGNRQDGANVVVGAGGQVGPGGPMPSTSNYQLPGQGASPAHLHGQSQYMGLPSHGQPPISVAPQVVSGGHGHLPLSQGEQRVPSSLSQQLPKDAPVGPNAHENQYHPAPPSSSSQQQPVTPVPPQQHMGRLPHNSVLPPGAPGSHITPNQVPPSSGVIQNPPSIPSSVHQLNHMQPLPKLSGSTNRDVGIASQTASHTHMITSSASTGQLSSGVPHSHSQSMPASSVPSSYGSNIPHQYSHPGVGNVGQVGPPSNQFPSISQIPSLTSTGASHAPGGNQNVVTQRPEASQPGHFPPNQQGQFVSQGQMCNQQQTPTSRHQQVKNQQQHPVNQHVQPVTHPQPVIQQQHPPHPVSQQRQVIPQQQPFHQQMHPVNPQLPVSHQQLSSQQQQPLNQQMQPMPQQLQHVSQQQPVSQSQPVSHQQVSSQQQQPLDQQMQPMHQQPQTVSQQQPTSLPQPVSQPQAVNHPPHINQQQQSTNSTQSIKHSQHPGQPHTVNPNMAPQANMVQMQTVLGPSSKQPTIGSGGAYGLQQGSFQPSQNMQPQSFSKHQTFPSGGSPSHHLQQQQPRSLGPQGHSMQAQFVPGYNVQGSQHQSANQPYHPPSSNIVPQAPLPRFGSPVHQHQQPSHRPPQPTAYPQPGGTQFQPRHAPPSQSVPVSQYQQQPTGVPQGYQSAVTGPHQQGMQQVPRYPGPAARTYQASQPMPVGQYPSQLGGNPVKNVNMRLKTEQENLPQPTLQPTKLTKDLLSSSPEGSSPLIESEIMVPQNVKTDQAPPEPKVTQAPPQSSTELLSSLQQNWSEESNGSTSSNLAILSQPLTTSSGLPVKDSKVTPNSNLAILSQPVIGPDLKAQTSKTPLTLPAGQGVSTTENEDPYLDKMVLDRFVDEVERLEKYVEGLNRQMLSGPTVLDGVWKEVNDDQERVTRQFSISVARCYSTKNRHPDIMPYDHNRVLLKTSKDDFINSSYLRDLSPSTPTFIATQAPLPTTMETFWQMIYEQQVFLLVMLVSSKAKGTSEFHQYWPSDRGQPQLYGAFSVMLQSSKHSEFHTERFLQLTHVPTKQVRTVLHMQFTAWPEFGVPEQSSDLLQFISQVQNYHLQQKQLTLPIVVHCSAGVGRTGTFCTIYSAVQDINSGKGITDIPKVVKNLRRQRKWMVAEKEQLKFCYEAVLCYAQQVLAKRGIFTKLAGTMSPRPSKNAPSRLNSFDVIMGADSVQSLQHSISKLSVRPPEVHVTTTETPMPQGEGDLPQAGESTRDGSNHVGNDGPSVVGDDIIGAGTNGLSQTFSATNSAQPDELDGTVDQSTSTGIDGNVVGVPGDSTLPVTPDSGSSTPKTKSVHQMLESNLDNFSANTQNFVPPDVVESSTISQGGQEGISEGDARGVSQGVLPSILEDLSPQNFSIKEEEKSKGKKFTKEDFEKRKNNLTASQGNSGDPFDSLDPLWSMKGDSSAEKSS